MTPFVERMVRAARLDAQVYEEIEADQGAMGQAMAVVVLSSLAAGLGTADAGFGGLLIGAVGALVGWLIWAFLTYVIGTKLLPEPETHADLGQLLRTTGFSSAPGILRVLGIVPGLRGVVFFAASVWMLIAMVIAVRQALDYKSTGRAVGVCAIGFVVQIIVLAILFAMVLGSAQGPTV